VVKSGVVDRGPEWRAFNSSEFQERSRTGYGYTLTLYDKGLTTVFRADKDCHGNSLRGETRFKMARLRRFDNRSKLDEAEQRNLSTALAELDRLSTLLHLPTNAREMAALIYRKALKADLLRGRSIEGFVAASLYAACRSLQIPKPLREITRVSPRRHQEVARIYRILLKELSLKMPVEDPIKFVPSIAAKVNLGSQAEAYAIDLLRAAKRRGGLTGKDPRGLAAAALYKAGIVTNNKRIQKEIAEAAGTTEVTLRNRLRGIEALLAGED